MTTLTQSDLDNLRQKADVLIKRGWNVTFSAQTVKALLDHIVVLMGGRNVQAAKIAELKAKNAWLKEQHETAYGIAQKCFNQREAALVELQETKARIASLESERDQLRKQVHESSIALTGAEVQSGLDRVRWAELLILQLPDNHDGRNSWLLNYGRGNESAQIRERNSAKRIARELSAASALEQEKAP